MKRTKNAKPPEKPKKSAAKTPTPMLSKDQRRTQREEARVARRHRRVSKTVSRIEKGLLRLERLKVDTAALAAALGKVKQLERVVAQ